MRQGRYSPYVENACSYFGASRAGSRCCTSASVAPIGLTPGGLPVGVQIAGPQYGDRTCIAFARLLERGFQAFVPPPGFE